MKKPNLFVFGACLGIAGCASYETPPLPADHPANSAAAEASQPAARPGLDIDQTSRETRAQLSAKKESQP